MIKRIITGILLMGFVVAMLYFGTVSSYIFYDALILAFSTLGMYEIWKSLKSAEYKVYIAPLLIVTFGVYPMWHFFGSNGMWAAFITSIVVALIQFTLPKDTEIKNLWATLFGIIYPYMFMALSFILTQSQCAIFSLAFAILVPVGSDVFAYFVGSLIGKHKLCPEISPKKTVEGAIGGLFGATTISVAFYFLFEYNGGVFGNIGYVPFTDSVGGSLAIFIGLGFVGGVLSQLGDLAASRVKRQFGIKDFGNIFPGHGGSLDRLDSIMFMLALLFIAYIFIY